MDEMNYRVPQIITIQPDSVIDLPDQIPSGGEPNNANRDVPIDVSGDGQFNTTSPYSPIVVHDDEPVITGIRSHNISPLAFGNIVTDIQPNRNVASSNVVSINRNTTSGFLQVSSGRAIPTFSAKVTSATRLNARPNILTKRPAVKTLAQKLVVVPVNKQGAISMSSSQKDNQNNPIVLSIGNLGTITEQRYFNTPISVGATSSSPVVSGSYSLNSSTSRLSAAKKQFQQQEPLGTQLSRVPKASVNSNKKKIASSTKSSARSDSSGSKSKTKDIEGEQERSSSDTKILGVKQNDIFFCNYCNYFAVFETKEIFKHYVEHHKKSCTGINCNKLFNTEFDMQQHIYKDHPELRGKLAPKEVVMETKCLETFKKPVYVFSRTALTKVINCKDAPHGTGSETNNVDEDYLYTEKLFAPPKSYAKFMQQRYPEYKFNFKHLDELPKESSESTCQWSCPFCSVVNKSFNDVFNHIRASHHHERFHPPVAVYSFGAASDGTDKEGESRGPVIGHVRTSTDNNPWHSEIPVTVNGLELQATVSSQSQTLNLPSVGVKQEKSSSEDIQSQLQEAVTKGSGDGVSSYLLTQKKASCGHYMPSFDTHRKCKHCRDACGDSCQAMGPKCSDCEGWSEELWGFVTSMYPENNDEEGQGKEGEDLEGSNTEFATEKRKKSSKVKTCGRCSLDMPLKDRHSKCKKCRTEKESNPEKQSATLDTDASISSIDKLQQQEDYRTHQCQVQSWGMEVHLTEKESSSSKVKKCVYCSFYMPVKDRHSKCTRCRNEQTNDPSKQSSRRSSTTSDKSGSKSKEKPNEAPKTPVKNCFVQLQSSPHRDKKMCKSCRQPMFMFDLHNNCDSCRSEKGVFCSANGMRCNICKVLGDSYWDTLEALTKSEKRNDSVETRQSFDSDAGGEDLSDDGDNDFMDIPEDDDYVDVENTPNEINREDTIDTSDFVEPQSIKNVEEIVLDYIPNDLKMNVHTMYTFNPDKKSYTCIKCKTSRKGSRARNNIIQHVKIHQNGRLWGCPYCKYQNAAKNRMSKHVLRVHPGKPPKIVRRMPYSESVSGSTGWEVEGEYCVDIGLGQAKCNTCDMKYTGSFVKNNIRKHLRLKHRGKKFSCELCNFLSGKKERVVDHIGEKHPNEECQVTPVGANKKETEMPMVRKEKSKPRGVMSIFKRSNMKPDDSNKFGCGYCSFVTSYYSSVIRHSRMKHRSKPMKVIQRKLNQVAVAPPKEQPTVDLSHVKTEKTYSLNAETGWYQCTSCHYKTKSSFAEKLMSVHFRIHHSADAESWSHKCPYCPYSSLHKPYVARHVRKKHPPGSRPKENNHQSSPTETGVDMAMETSPQDEEDDIEMPVATYDESADSDAGGDPNWEDSEDAAPPRSPVATSVTLGTLIPEATAPGGIENIHNKYSYLPDSKVASCKICTHTTQGKHALSTIKEHVQMHLESNLLPSPQDWISSEATSNTIKSNTTGAPAKSKVRDFVYNKKAGKAECKLCGYMTMGNVAIKLMKNHLENHAEKCNKPIYICGYCNMNSLIKRSILRHHQQRHSDQPIKVFTKSPRKMSGQESTENVLSPQNKNKEQYTLSKRHNMCVCKMCGFMTRGKLCIKSMDAHLTNHAENVKKAVYTCAYCKMNSYSTKTIQRHQRKLHPKKPIKIVNIALSVQRSQSMLQEENETEVADDTGAFEDISRNPENGNQRQKHQKYTYLPDIKVASCKLCSFETKGRNACLDMLAHVKDNHTALPRAATPVPATPEVVYGCSYCDFSSASSTKAVSDHIKQRHPDLIIKVKVRSNEPQPARKVSTEQQQQPPSRKFSTSTQVNKSHRKGESHQRKVIKMKVGSKYKKLSKTMKQAKYFLRCPYCDRCGIFPSTMANHIRCVHPDCDQDIQCDSLNRPAQNNPQELARLACLSHSYVKLIRLEDMNSFPPLKEVLETTGSVLRSRLDNRDKKWFGLLESDKSESSSNEMETESYSDTVEESSSDQIWRGNNTEPRFVELPNIDDVFDLKGKPRQIYNLHFREKDPLIFSNRFRCFCKKSFSDLTLAKIHAVDTHASVSKSFGAIDFKEFTDMYAKAKFAPNKVYLCCNIECVFFSKLPSICEIHKHCSGNPFRFWGSESNVVQIMYRNLASSDAKRRLSSASSSLSLNGGENIGSEMEGAMSLVDLSGAWNYDSSEVTDSMWRTSQSNSNFVMVPNIDDILHIRGNAKILSSARFSKPNPIFKDRFLCKHCKIHFSDLTQAKIHCIRSHPNQYEWFGGVAFLKVKDMVAQDRFAPNTVYLCTNPGCVFLERMSSKCVNHFKCSGNPLQYWGKNCDLKLGDKWEIVNNPNNTASENEQITCTKLPMPEEVMDTSGNRRTMKQLGGTHLRQVDFSNRFLCYVCDRTCDELADIKSHYLQEHSQKMLRRKGYSVFYVAVVDMYAKLKSHVALMYVCANPECAFYTKLESQISRHVQCSSEWWESTPIRETNVKKEADKQVVHPEETEDIVVSDEAEAIDAFSTGDVPSDSELDEVSEVLHADEEGSAAQALSDRGDSQSENGGALSPTLSLIEEDLCMLTEDHEGMEDILLGDDDDVAAGNSDLDQLLDNHEINRQSSHGESISDTEVPETGKKAEDKTSEAEDILAEDSHVEHNVKENEQNVDGVSNMENNSQELAGNTVDDSTLNKNEKNQGLESDDVKSNEQQDSNRTEENISGHYRVDSLYDEMSDSDTLLNHSLDQQNEANGNVDMEVDGGVSEKHLYDSVSDTEFSTDFEEGDEKDKEGMGTANGSVLDFDKIMNDATKSKNVPLSEENVQEKNQGDADLNHDNTNEITELLPSGDSTGNDHAIQMETIDSEDINACNYVAINPSDAGSQSSSMEDKLKSTGMLTTTYIPTAPSPGLSSEPSRFDDREGENDSDMDTGLGEMVEDIAQCSNLFLQPSCSLDGSMNSSDILDGILDPDDAL